MKNVPKTIYLQIGDDCPDDVDFADVSRQDVTWCQDRINDNDIEYGRANAEAIAELRLWLETHGTCDHAGMVLKEIYKRLCQ